MTLEMLMMWVVVGLATGWLAGIVMKGGGYGLIWATSFLGSPAALWGAGSSGPWRFLQERGCSRRSPSRSSGRSS